MTTKANPKTDQKTASDDKAKLKVIAGGSDSKPFREIIPPEPHVKVSDKGVFYIGVRYDPSAKRHVEDEPLRLCDRLDILGRGKDEGGGHYRIVRWNARGDRQERTHAIPLREIGDRHSWAVLREGGLALASSKRQLEKLADWLQTDGPDDMHSVSHCGGWNLGAYVLPSGELLGVPIKPLFYNGDRSNAHAYGASGSVAEWRESVARLCRGNSRPLIAIGAALAAPLLHLAGLESGGFHIYGTSGSGKTTSARAGASVWGMPNEQILNWDSTALALANAAAARNDGLMLLDEISQGDPGAVAQAAYRLFNGTGKMQGDREGGNRKMLRWRVFVLSTGEADLNAFMRTGNRRTMAGQEVRLASIPADAGAEMGAFERLNGEASPEALAKAIEQAATTHFGAVGRVFVEYVAQHQGEIAKRLRKAIEMANQALPAKTSGQVHRVASRFAITGEALEIATEAGLTGFATGEARDILHRCLKQWVETNGLTNREETQIIEQVEHWFSANGHSPRFLDWDVAKKNIAINPDGYFEPSSINCAGWRRRKNGAFEFLVNKGAFENELCLGFNKAYAAKVLMSAGFIKGEGGLPQVSRTQPTGGGSVRFYLFVKTDRGDG